MSRIIELAFKSTLDKLVNDLAAKLTELNPLQKQVFAFDLDDTASERAMHAGAEHALVYQYTNLATAPRHPLYSVDFLVGAKTTDDLGNYDMTTLLTDLGEVFAENLYYELYDYSDVGEGEDPGEQLGTLMILSADTGPQLFEKQSGIRLLQISGKVVAHGLD